MPEGDRTEPTLRQRWEKLSRFLPVDKIYLETHRDGIVVDDETLKKAKKFFADRGVATSGGITLTINERNMFQTFCYSDPEQRKLSRYAIGYQVPFRPERKLLRDDAAEVEQILQRWSGADPWPDVESADAFRAAMQFGSTAHCALEYHRWAVRSVPRQDGRRFADAMSQPIRQPVLQVIGRNDGSLLTRTYDGSEDFVVGRYERYEMNGVGHFPQEEDPSAFNGLILRWLASLD